MSIIEVKHTARLEGHTGIWVEVERNKVKEVKVTGEDVLIIYT